MILVVKRTRPILVSCVAYNASCLIHCLRVRVTGQGPLVGEGRRAPPISSLQASISWVGRIWYRAEARLRDLRAAWYSLQVRTLGSRVAAGPSSLGMRVQRLGWKLAAAATASLRKRARPTRRTGARAAAPLRAKVCSCAAFSV